MKIPKTKTEFVIWLYCIAIAFLTACAVVIVMKLIFWPPCTQVRNTCVIDGWSVAGLAATVLAVAATVLAVLGAAAVAAWWVALNTRVTNQVNQLYEIQEKKINSEFNQLLAEQQQQLEKLILKSLVTDAELEYLRIFESPEAFLIENSMGFISGLRDLLLRKFIDRTSDSHGIRPLEEVFRQGGQVNIKEHFTITEAGREYLRQVE